MIKINENVVNGFIKDLEKYMPYLKRSMEYWKNKRNHKRDRKPEPPFTATILEEIRRIEKIIDGAPNAGKYKKLSKHLHFAFRLYHSPVSSVVKGK
jgi:hypothetical protein